jgi:ABC-2 type transport system permease protein
MARLLQIEWMKLKNYRAFKIFGVLYLGGIISALFITNFFYTQLAPREIRQMIKNPFDYPTLWATAGWLNSWMLFFPGWIIINHCVNEFNFKTHRQNIIDGWSREQFITSKILLIVIFAVVITLINIISTMWLGAMVGASFSFDGFYYMGYVFVQSLVYIFFAFTLAILLRRSGLAAGIFFLFGLIFEFLIAGLLNYQAHMKPIGYFFPLQVSDQLLPIPFLNELESGVPADTILLIGCFAYCVLYIFIAFRKFKRDDL